MTQGPWFVAETCWKAGAEAESLSAITAFRMLVSRMIIHQAVQPDISGEKWLSYELDSGSGEEQVESLGRTS
jgi:hypothetical protein